METLKKLFIILVVLLNLNVNSTDLPNHGLNRRCIEFYTYSDLYTFIDESINLPGHIFHSSVELLPPYILFDFEDNITNQRIAQLIHQYITVEIKGIS